jgi:putative redox protein
MPSERITFPGHDGTELAARLDLPQGKPLATALFAHCFTCGKDIAAARRIAARLAGMGIAVLRFDFTGLGHSGGEFANTTFASNVGDLVAAARYLDGRGIAPSLLIGHSLGGAAVLKARAEISSVRAVVTLNAPFDPGHVTNSFTDALPEIKARGDAQVNLGGTAFRITRDFVDSVATAQLQPAIAGLNAALLVMHGPRDAIVGIDNATAIFQAAKHPKSFVTLDDADHLISRAQDAEYAAQVIAAWASRYLVLKPPAPPPGAPEGIVRVTEADPDGPGRRARNLWRQQSRHVALWLSRRRSGRLHLDDHPHVCPSQGLAADRDQRRCQPRQGPRPGRRIRQRQPHRRIHPGDPA